MRSRFRRLFANVHHLDEKRNLMRSALTLCLFLLSSRGELSAWAQGSNPVHEPNARFDAVSIRQIEAYKSYSTGLSSGQIFTRHNPCVYSDDKVVCQLSLEELIEEAYQRKRYEVTGPAWLKEDMFVFQALLVEKTSKEEARVMMQEALEERFGLRHHTEKKPIKAYVMVAAPGGQHLIPADAPERQKKVVVNGGPPSFISSSLGRFAAMAIPLDLLGIWVQRAAGLDCPVLNGTGLDGQYKFDLHWDPDDQAGSEGGSQDTGILVALKKQAGLVLHKEDVAVEMLVIDKVNRVPTAN